MRLSFVGFGRKGCRWRPRPSRCLSAERSAARMAAFGGFTGPQFPRPMNLTFGGGRAGSGLVGGEVRDWTKAHGLGLVAGVQLGIDGAIDDEGQRRGSHGRS